jgi:hypothetical protein
MQTQQKLFLSEGLGTNYNTPNNTIFTFSYSKSVTFC